MAKGHHLQVKSHLPLFHNFMWFNIKTAVAHHPIIKKESDELFAKGAIEPSSGGAGFYSNLFVVPKCTAGLWPMLNFKWFNCYMHMSNVKMPTIRHVQQLFQCGDYAFAIDLKDTCLYVPVVKHHHNFFILKYL